MSGYRTSLTLRVPQGPALIFPGVVFHPALDIEVLEMSGYRTSLSLRVPQGPALTFPGVVFHTALDIEVLEMSGYRTGLTLRVPQGPALRVLELESFSGRSLATLIFLGL